MIIYLDNCCFNRPFDDQKQLRIRIETEAKLGIQEAIRSGEIELAWSYILDFENEKNPFPDRRERVREWRNYAQVDIVESVTVKAAAASFHEKGLRKIDALHIACAVDSGCEYFVTTDDGILRASKAINGTEIVDPVDFVKKEL